MAPNEIECDTPAIDDSNIGLVDSGCAAQDLGRFIQDSCRSHFACVRSHNLYCPHFIQLAPDDVAWVFIHSHSKQKIGCKYAMCIEVWFFYWVGYSCIIICQRAFPFHICSITGPFYTHTCNPTANVQFVMDMANSNDQGLLLPVAKALKRILEAFWCAAIDLCEPYNALIYRKKCT